MSKELPINFSVPMVRAILGGRKTQSRCVVKWNYGPNGTRLTPIEQVDTFADIVQGLSENLSGDPVPFCEAKCPYGVPGDRLWVREKHFPAKDWRHAPLFADAPDYLYAADEAFIGCQAWKPSIHLPRNASRIILEVASVRVERLQDISEQDAIAEGAERNDSPGSDPEWEPDWGYRTPTCSHYPDGCECFPNATARDWFEEVWESINGKGSWAANPWVWVLQFKRIGGAT